MEFDGSVGVDMEDHVGNEQTGKIDVHDDAGTYLVMQAVQKCTWPEQQVQLKDGESNHRDGDGGGSGSQAGDDEVQEDYDDGINDVFTLLSQDKQDDDIARSGITDAGQLSDSDLTTLESCLGPFESRISVPVLFDHSLPLDTRFRSQNIISLRVVPSPKEPVDIDSFIFSELEESKYSLRGL